MRRLFGTDGIRGTANIFPITPDIALKAGQALATCLRDSGETPARVIIGKDTRISGYMLESALTAGLVSYGVDVLLVGPLPTPAIARLAKTMRCTAGIMITASHNPYEDNGFKVFDCDGFKIPDATEERMERYIFGETPLPAAPAAAGIGKAVRINDAPGRYIEYAKSAVGHISLHGLKLVIDCSHGAAYQVAPLIFRELGAEVIVTGASPNGLNINDGCGALHPETTGALVLSHGADLGIALDGDADRVIFIDSHGQPVSGDKILGLCALDMHRRGHLHGGKVVLTVMSNLGLHEALHRAGVGVITTGVGDRLVIEALRDHGLSFGGENCGHIIFSDESTTGDGILSALSLLRIMKETGKGIGELAQDIREYPQELRSLKVPAKPPLESLPHLCSAMDEASREFGHIGRHLIRYSGTENKLRILVEHRDHDAVRTWLDRFTEAATTDLANARA